MIYIAFLFFTLLILLFGLYQWQYFMVFSPTYYREGELEDGFEILSITTDDGVELEGVVYEPKNPSATLLFFAGRSHDSVGLIKKLSLSFPHARVITFNYRSYGRSEGVVNEKNIFTDGLKIAELVQKNYGDFYILGFSIGSSVTSFVASKIESKGVFLVGSFDSISSLAKEKHGVNLSWLLRYKFDNTKFVDSITAKTYLFVSRDDEITYIENSRKLKNHVKNLAFYEEFDNLTHKELLWNDKVINKINGVIG
ncbi:MAG: alpha/beta hydrolase [Campylobacterota bacterium]|nr:alpha/beta hydrolase [Campylobacterota bacterium]